MSLVKGRGVILDLISGQGCNIPPPSLLILKISVAALPGFTSHGLSYKTLEVSTLHRSRFLIIYVFLFFKFCLPHRNLQ